MSFLKQLLSYMPVSVQDAYLKQRYDRQLSKWEAQKKPVPVPHIVKQKTINLYQNKYNVGVLFETGTYLGDMVWAQRKNFKTIYSIELSEALYEKAKKRFENFPHIHIKQGDSGKVLHTLVDKMSEKAIFFLDGHYSGGITAKGDKECPIYEELSAIFQSGQEHILLIDDARCFIGKEDYPTMESLSKFIKDHYSNSLIDIQDDIIRIELKK